MPAGDGQAMCLDGGVATVAPARRRPRDGAVVDDRRAGERAHAPRCCGPCTPTTSARARSSSRPTRSAATCARCAASAYRAGPAWLVQAAVGVARAARDEAGNGRTLIAGSMAPSRTATARIWCRRTRSSAQHRWLASEMLDAGVDLVLIETINSVREARIALGQVLTAGGRAWVSFVCAEGARLLSGEPLSGEPLADAARAVEADGAEAVLVNARRSLRPSSACASSQRCATARSARTPTSSTVRRPSRAEGRCLRRSPSRSSPTRLGAGTTSSGRPCWAAAAVPARRTSPHCAIGSAMANRLAAHARPGAAVAVPGEYPCGLTWDGAHLWHSDQDALRVHAIDQPTAQWSVSSNANGFEPTWPSTGHCYARSAAARSGCSSSTRTPAG